MANVNYEGNACPVSGQIQATDLAVCGLNPLLINEKRTHRNVGYKNSVSRFHMLVMSKCYELSRELMSGSYQPMPGEVHEVFEPKYRITVSSKYRDRVPQSSFVTNYFYDAVIPHLIKNNFACIKGRGVDDARNAFKEILRNADPTDECLKADMQGYFASIDHEKLYGELFRYITDDWARWFFQVTIENTRKSVGLDLGSEVYQLSATSFMNRLDHALEKLGNGSFIRYQDDLIFVGNRELCREALRLIREETARLNLKISEKKTFIQPISRPVHFLGFSFLRKPTGRVTSKRLRSKVHREKRKLKRMKNKQIPIDRVAEHYRSVRECMKRGSRSDLMKLDKYVNQLFGGLKV